MIRTSIIAGSIGMPVDAVIELLRHAQPLRSKIVPVERNEPRPASLDLNRIQVLYDAENQIVYDVKEG